MENPIQPRGNTLRREKVVDEKGDPAYSGSRSWTKRRPWAQNLLGGTVGVGGELVVKVSNNIVSVLCVWLGWRCASVWLGWRLRPAEAGGSTLREGLSFCWPQASRFEQSFCPGFYEVSCGAPTQSLQQALSSSSIRHSLVSVVVSTSQLPFFKFKKFVLKIALQSVSPNDHA